MSLNVKKTLLLFLFLLIYSLLFYFLIHGQLRMDFTSFYSSALAYKQNTNPYLSLVADYYAIPIKLPANLNPPFFLQLIQPLAQFNFPVASVLWFICSFVLGAIGALISFKLSCSEHLFQKNRLIFLFIYLAMYSTLVNAGIGQIGGILLFFIMNGYYFYQQKYDYWAGIFWGTIIALKLFPGLLFLFVLSQKRYKVLIIMLITSLFTFFLPVLIQGPEIYSLYFNMLPRILWFGDNWNASVYGVLFRLFIDIKNTHNLVLIKITYLCIFVILSLWYMRMIIVFQKTTLINNQRSDHRSFCLTLVMMLLISPMGWLYYFSLLLMPLTIIWQSLHQEQSTSNKTELLWALSLFLINFPMGYVEVINMSTLLYKLTFFSFYFYGLVLIAYLISHLKPAAPFILMGNEEKNMALLPSMYLALALSLFITLTCFIIHLMKYLIFDYHNIPLTFY